MPRRIPRSSKQTKETLDLVQPAGTRGIKVQVIAGSPCKPAFYLGHLVSAVVIHDQVNVKVFRDGGVDSFQEAQEFLLIDWRLAGGYIQSGEKRRGPVAHVIMTLAGRSARSQREDWPCPIQCLNLTFSSTHNTSARSGGFRYRPTMSRTFSTKNGSEDTLNVSTRWGCNENARHMRETADCDNPLACAMVRVDQCVPCAGTVSTFA